MRDNSDREDGPPALDLDCVYGDGNEASPFLYHPDHHGFMLFGTKQNNRDLARNSHGTALIGDFRKYENQILSQLRAAFVQMHNSLMTALKEDESMVPAAFSGIRAEAMAQGIKPQNGVFQAVRRVLRLHYQWMVMHDFLPAFVDAHVLKDIVAKFAVGGLPKPFTKDSPVMPIEFSGAACSFGHATVQNDPLTIGAQTLSIEDSRKLPHHNVFRDRMTLELASDQQMARLMHVPEIAAPKELTTHGISKTPLRYYCLHEAESHGGKLGPVGGTIVAGTLLRFLSLDPDSLLCSAHDFKLWTTLGASKAGNFSLGHMLACVEAARDAIAHADDLITG